ncbi:hypothetical protein BJV78DRAFT_757084 [Lactifluus subvellereus]|nr:hypothetical protein BJV78DRAFT_757084 [Lactifluus subvellereus]
MAPKGGNAKKESGRAKKAENEANKRAAAAEAKERAEAVKWTEGERSGKSKEEKEEKRKAELARKAENARLLAEEEASAQTKKATPKAGAKKATKSQPKPAGPGAIAAGGEVATPTASAESSSKNDGTPQEVESFSATGIDNALDLLEVVNAKMDKASIGNQAAGIEKHPERRFKAAFNAYVESELPNIRAEVKPRLRVNLVPVLQLLYSQQPGLRLQQYKDLLFKQFQKSPENPFNQTTVEYNATSEEKVEALRQKQDEIRERLREKA